MAIATINQLVHERLTYLNSGSDNTVIDSKITQEFYFLQSQTEKTDDEVEIESNYKPLQKMLIASLVSWRMLSKRITENMAGSGGSSTVTPGKIVKKAKADVVEAEFEIPKADDGIFLGMSASALLDQLAKEVCSFAAMLHYYIPEVCDQPIVDIIPPFKVYDQTCHH